MYILRTKITLLCNPSYKEDYKETTKDIKF